MATCRRPSPWISAPVALVCGLLSGCSGGDGTPDPTGPRQQLAIQAVTATAQTTVAGTSVSTPPAVRVIDPAGLPVAGVPVTFAVGSGLGRLTGPAQTTDGEGLARVESWTLGPTVGANTLVATIASSASVTFSATGTAGPPVLLVKETEDPGPLLVGTLAPSPPTVRVMDALGNPVAGITVTFTVFPESLPSSKEFVLTDSTGTAAMASWVISPFVGSNNVWATVPGIKAILFSATGIPDTPTLMVPTRVTDQSAIAGAKVSAPPAVRVTDKNGSAVPGLAVTFDVTEGDGLVDGARSAIVKTDTAGVAALRNWRLGTELGSNTVVASLDPWTESFTATAIPSPPVGQRAWQDRPDDVTGLQMHVIYVTSRGGLDRNLDRNTVLENSVRLFQLWFAGQTGKTIRQDTFEGRLDVTAYQSSLTDQEIATAGFPVVMTLFLELRMAGFDEPGKKYLVYYDGSSPEACGGAIANGAGAAMYLNGLPLTVRCAAQPLPTGPVGPPGYWEFAGLHDFIHTLGHVDSRAPTHDPTNPFHTRDCSCDLMDGGNLGPWRPTLVDFGNNDYYADSLAAGLPNLRLDPWLIPAPAALMVQAAALSSRQAPLLLYHPHDLVGPAR